jgi:hypothetical protein
MVSLEFKRYYESLAGARTRLQTYLRSSSGHHFFVSGAEDDPELLGDLGEMSDEAAVDGLTDKYVPGGRYVAPIRLRGKRHPQLAVNQLSVTVTSNASPPTIAIDLQT